jgi:hypothetical protein
MSARVGAIVFSPIPYIPRVPGSYFFGFVLYHIIETLSLTTDRAMSLLWGSVQDPVGGSPANPPERPPAYEYGARSEMVLPASTVLRGEEEQKR